MSKVHYSEAYPRERRPNRDSSEYIKEEFQLSHPGGIVSRKDIKLTRESLQSMLKDGFQIDDFLVVEPLSPGRIRLRWAYWVCTGFGAIPVIYNQFMDSIFGSLFLICLAAFGSLKDIVFTPSSFLDFFTRTLVNLGFIALFSIVLEIIWRCDYAITRAFWDQREIQRTERFNQLQDQAKLANKYTTDFSYKYNPEFDPDIQYYALLMLEAQRYMMAKRA